MPNFAERLRMNSIYGGSNPFSPQVESPFDIVDEFNRRQPQQQPVLQQIGQQIASPDQEPQNTRMGYGGGINPYQEAQLAFKQKELESRERLAGEQLSSKEKLAADKLELEKQDQNIRQQRANVYDFKSKNPNSKFMQGRDGRLRAINPITNQVTDLGETGLSESELIELNQSNKLEVVKATGDQARETEGVRQRGRESLEDIRNRHARELKDLESEQPSKSANLPSQQKVALELKYNQLINLRPDLREFVKRDLSSGEIKVATPEEYPEMKEQIDYINRFLFGSPSKDVKLPSETKPEVKEFKVDPSKAIKQETTEERMARLKKLAEKK